MAVVGSEGVEAEAEGPSRRIRERITTKYWESVEMLASSRSRRHSRSWPLNTILIRIRMTLRELRPSSRRLLWLMIPSEMKRRGRLMINLVKKESGNKKEEVNLVVLISTTYSVSSLEAEWVEEWEAEDNTSNSELEEVDSEEAEADSANRDNSRDPRRTYLRTLMSKSLI